MTPPTPNERLEARLINIEKDIAAINEQLIILRTGVALARWLGPFIVSIAAVVIVMLK